MAVGKTGNCRQTGTGGKALKQLLQFSGIAPGKAAENHAGCPLKKSCLFQLGQAAVDLIDRFIHIFQHDHLIFRIRKIVTSGKACGNGQISGKNIAGNLKKVRIEKWNLK